MEQTIIGISGHKQAGKNTCYSYLRFWRPEAQEFSFAEALKRVCIDILGVEEWQAYGSDTEKNTLVPHLLWENFPIPSYTYSDGRMFIGRPNLKFPAYKYEPNNNKPEGRFFDGVVDIYSEQDGHPVVSRGHLWAPEKEILCQIIHNGEVLKPRTGPMTAREVLQYWGTEIFRRQYNQVWADACIRKIHKSKCKLAVITDCRFPNEVQAIQDAGGKVIRLTRNPFPEDKHPSEIALDEENFNQSLFDVILNNADMDTTQQSEELYAIMRRWGVISAKTVKRTHI